MFEIILYYVLPNVIMFGGIYYLCRYVENAVQHYIDNYEEYEKKLLDLKKSLL